MEVQNLEEIREQIEKEVREKIALEEEEKKKARKARSKKNKQPKVKATWDDVWSYAVWTRTYDHLKLDPRYDEWIDKLKDTKQLYLDVETHTPLAVKPWEEVETAMKEANFKDFKSVYNNILIEITGRDMKGVNKKNKGYPLDPKKGKIRLIQLGDKKNTYVFDVYKMTSEQREKLGYYFRDKFVIGQNIKFDLSFVCEEWGPLWLPEHCYCTMTIDKLICCSEYAFLGALRFDLAAIAERRCGLYLAKGYGDSDWGNPDLSKEQMNYAEEDIDGMRPIVKAQLAKLKEMGNSFVRIDRDPDKDLPFLSPLRKLHLIAAIECDVIPCFVRMMHKGIPVNTEVLKGEMIRRDEEFQKGCEELGFNVNSSQQVSQVLREQYQLNVDGTSSDAITQYASDYPIVQRILDLRSVDTINGLLKGFLEASQKYGDGRVHPSFTVYQAYSGRTACRDPNVQQVPRPLKPIWMMPPKGKVIINLDYPAIEMRLAAVYILEKIMLNAFKTGLDLHKKTAAFVNHCTEEEVTKDMRKKAKAVNFGYLYGCSAKRFKATAMTKYQLDYSIEECQQIRDQFFKGYPDLDRHVRRMYKLFPFGRTDVRFVVKTLLGRRIMVDKATNALNLPVQGSGADAAKLACIYFYHKLRHYKNGKYNDPDKVEAVSFVHDEYFIEADTKCLKFATRLLKKSMESAMNYLLGDYFQVKLEPEAVDFKGSIRDVMSEEQVDEFIHELNQYVNYFSGKQEAEIK